MSAVVPNHSDWPPGLRYAERVVRAVGYAAAAVAGLFVVVSASSWSDWTL